MAQKSFKKEKYTSLKDTVTVNLPKERWKDIPGFEGQYQLSDYGRVRSLSRWVYSENKPDTYRQGRIIKLCFTPSSKKKKKTDTDVDIQMKLHKDCIRYQFSVARYVYFLFVAAFDLSNHTVIVRRKDNDKLNCYYQNLLLASISEVAKEGFVNNKRKSKFQEQTKPVSQYTLKGKFVKTYNSSKEAGQATGVSSEYINDAARREVRPTANAYWRYGKPVSRINISMLENRLQNAMRTKRKKVQQFTLEGKLIKTYNSISEAAKAMKMASCSNISYVCMGKYYSSKGYKWKYAENLVI